MHSLHYFVLGLTSFLLCSTLSANTDAWLVDLRTASWTRPSDSEIKKLTFYRFDGKKWEKKTREEFYASEDVSNPTVVFVPGYTSTFSSTSSVGLDIVSLVGKKNECRYVFWNWPAERMGKGILHDVRAKAPIAEASGEYLSRFLSSVSPESRVCIIGFSFGGRIALDSVHKLYGKPKVEIPRINLVLAAPASDQNWLADKSKHGNAPKIAEHILVLYNPHDKALLFYQLLKPGIYPPKTFNALGRVGPILSTIQEDVRGRIESLNLYRRVGCQHRTLSYLNTPEFRSRIGEYVLFEEKQSVKSAKSE